MLALIQRWQSRFDCWFTMKYRSRVYEFKRVARAWLEVEPYCHCGRRMRPRGGYLMGGNHDWMGYQCPADRPWNFWKHPILTLRVKE